MQENDGQFVLPAYERAQLCLRAGELPQARDEAQAGLDAHGPHAGLYAVLGRAHVAEDDDDHDAAAERAYRAGLDAFPDDLDLLAAYAEFGLAADVMEQPGRFSRGRKAADRLRELAPDSPQALRIDGERPGPRLPSLAYVQRHDARVALTGGVDLRDAARQAGQAAEAWPYDRRLAVRAETLAALSSEGLVCLTLRAPYRAVLVLCALVAAWLLAVPALGLPGHQCLWALLALVPPLREQTVLRGARRRAERRMPAGYALPAPGAPDVPLPTPRERAALLLAFVIVAGACTGSFGWQYVRAADYPHYAAAVPSSFRGMPLETGNPMADFLDSSLASASLPQGADTFSGVYRDEDSGRGIAVFGATGDLHSEDPDDLYEGIREGVEEGGGSVRTTWTADPGPLGGRLECMTYEQFAASLTACAWVDKGSMGVVMTSGGSVGRETSAQAARELRRATLRPATPGVVV
ncbi:tetratricopeptide repeat protein [Streptomyces sp. NPDC102467]|uniref:tetratricopeptide repeat protein n=1 Tax=Streptomyces sp. NPDC102467 TaxID=3366179 RepID=UPI00380E930A